MAPDGAAPHPRLPSDLPGAPRPAAPRPGWLARPEGIAFALAGLSIGLHVLLAGAVPLSPQEAYYWQYARHLDLSYFDHPPLAAWTIRLTTSLFGDGERAVRLAAALHGSLFALFFFLAGRRLFGGRVALWAMVGALVLPVFALGQVVITPDAPLLAGWAAALYFTVRALDEAPTAGDEPPPYGYRARGGGGGRWLLAAGVAVGFAALGKYTGWLLAPQIFLVLLLDARGRALLLSPWPYLALALALAIFSPVVIWNAQHGWISFGFQFSFRGATAGAPSPGRFARYLGLQALALTPLMFLALWGAAVAAAGRWRQASFRTCAVFSLPALALFLAASPFMWVKGNWPAPAYPTALLAAVALHLGAARPRRGFALAALGVAAAGTLYLHVAMAIPSLPFPAKEDATGGWKELAARVHAEQQRLPGPSFALGCFYKVASTLAYYLPGRPETYSSNAMGEAGLQYDFWFRPESIEGREGIVVLDRRDWKWCLQRERYCQPLEQLPSLTVHRGGSPVTTFELWRCRYRSR